MSQEKTVSNNNKLDNKLDMELEGLKLKIGDKLFDPNDPKIRKPHSRVIFPKNNLETGGLLQTGGHRPHVDTNSNVFSKDNKN